MYIRINIITQEKQLRDFYLHIADLEYAFEVMQKIANRDEVVNIRYFDQQGELPISLEAIYSPVFLNPIRQLKQQWESILNPLNATEFNNMKLRSRQNERLATLRRKQLYHFQQLQQQMLQLLETTQANLTDGPQKKRLLALHQQTIQRCQRSIAQLEAFSNGLATERRLIE